MRYQKSLRVADRQQVPLNWLPSQAALGLPQQAVKIQGVVLAFCGGWIKVVRMGVCEDRRERERERNVVSAEHSGESFKNGHETRDSPFVYLLFFRQTNIHSGSD